VTEVTLGQAEMATTIYPSEDLSRLWYAYADCLKMTLYSFLLQHISHTWHVAVLCSI